MTNGKLKADVFAFPQVLKLVRDIFFENFMNQLKKKSMAELQKCCGILPRKQKEVILQEYCAQFVGEPKKPGLQHEFAAALLAFTLRLLSTESQ
jgi:hypothetical protein